ncbi:hypothetical protein M0813_17688 [Anaeramoeba flamelloides]|uniref:Uncharacterized protein n=1 Tax=Anaeramoeba flamelloides TaxID=1746091 RepID=A0ABQ8YUT0_9EUKA|nr:hypothetical protein M0813_17688 [Anaeramoeba flamelloides]
MYNQKNKNNKKKKRKSKGKNATNREFKYAYNQKNESLTKEVKDLKEQRIQSNKKIQKQKEQIEVLEKKMKQQQTLIKKLEIEDERVSGKKKKKEDERKSRRKKKINQDEIDQNEEQQPSEQESEVLEEEECGSESSTDFRIQPYLEVAFDFGNDPPSFTKWKEKISNRAFTKKVLFTKEIIGYSPQEMGKLSYDIQRKCKNYAKDNQQKQLNFSRQMREIVNQYLSESISNISQSFENLKKTIGTFWYELVLMKSKIKYEDFDSPVNTYKKFSEFLEALLSFIKKNEQFKSLFEEINTLQKEFLLFCKKKEWFYKMTYIYLGAYLLPMKNIKFRWNGTQRKCDSETPWLSNTKIEKLTKRGYYIKQRKKDNKVQSKGNKCIIIFPGVVKKNNGNNKKKFSFIDKIGKKAFLV